ncbi:MAG: hypothetical protein JXA93_11400 [Anaerolineae bacterium]|nr:hypothetical protein [Anaerolineae bacterium]
MKESGSAKNEMHSPAESHSIQGEQGAPVSPVAHDPAAIRCLLRDAFRVESLRAFCLDRPLFRRALDQFPYKGSLEEMISALIEYCETRDLLAELLHEIEQENPRQFARYAPDLYLDAAAALQATDEPAPARLAETAPASGAPSVTLQIGDGARVRGVNVAGRDVVQEMYGGDALPLPGKRAVLRGAAVAIGALGLVVGVLWLSKVGPALTLEFAIPLALICAALVVGGLGLFMPGRRDRSGRGGQEDQGT